METLNVYALNEAVNGITNLSAGGSTSDIAVAPDSGQLYAIAVNVTADITVRTSLGLTLSSGTPVPVFFYVEVGTAGGYIIHASSEAKVNQGDVIFLTSLGETANSPVCKITYLVRR